MGSEIERMQAKKIELECEQLKKQLEKLELEVKELRETVPSHPMIRHGAVLVAAFGLAIGIFQYSRTEESKSMEMHREALKPLWEQQIKLYLEAADTAATIAVETDGKARRDAELRFWKLYWGQMAVVEDISFNQNSNGRVAETMDELGDALRTDAKDRDREEIKQLAYRFSKAARRVMLDSFRLHSSHEYRTRQ